MHLSPVDWAIVAGVLLLTLGVGFGVARRASKDEQQFFLSGRTLSWRLLGLSMVATTFAADTPGLVTQFVRESGVAANWQWWAFLLTGVTTTFLFARLWRRSGVVTDLEFYELRYSGKPAAFLRVFRAVYLGLVFNVIVMAIVSLAAIKIAHVLVGLGPLETELWCNDVTMAFSAIGGFRAVVLTDCLLFGLAMLGAGAAAYYAVNHPDVGGLAGLMQDARVREKASILPSISLTDSASLDSLMRLLVVPLLIQWWSIWYPGAEPGGGGYLAQRFLAARSEADAQGAALLFNAAHYALRPWPWILVALASLIVFPDLDSLRARFPELDPSKIGGDLAYAAMLTHVPIGWRGVVVASLLAAYMSTISTHLNWGSSYLVNDVYLRCFRSGATSKRQVLVGRLSTVLLMVAAGALALRLNTARQGFDILLQLGAGTGLVFALRWYWSRINAYSEIAAMAASLAVAIASGYEPFATLPAWRLTCLSVLATTTVWMLVTLVTPAEPDETLESFYRKTLPPGPGWRSVRRSARANGRPLPDIGRGAGLKIGLLRCVLAGVAIYAALFATGHTLYGNQTLSAGLWALSLGSATLLWRAMRSEANGVATEPNTDRGDTE